MADRWEEEAERVWSAINEDPNAELAPVAVTLTHIAEALRRAESSGREAERAECAAVADAEAAAYEQSVRDMDSAGQGALATAETRAVLACRRVAQAIRVGARPGGTNGR